MQQQSGEAQPDKADSKLIQFYARFHKSLHRSPSTSIHVFSLQAVMVSETISRHKTIILDYGTGLEL